jgi:VRR-NUC domain
MRYSMALTKTKKPIASESSEQRALVKWLSYHPIVRNHFMHITNEGKRSPITGRHLLNLGLKPGASDLFIYYPTKRHHGLFLEVKRNKKYTPSEMRTESWKAQEKFLDSVKSVGFAGEVCYGAEDGIAIVARYLLA